MKNKFRLAVVTHQGMVRTNNEDAYAVSTDLNTAIWYNSFQEPNSPAPDEMELAELEHGGVLMAVADGMGGANAGEVAAKIAIETICKTLNDNKNISFLRQSPQPALIDVLQAANRGIVAYSREFPASRGMGTTCVLAWIMSDGCRIAWVGDSRAYLYNAADGLLQISKDHSLVQELVDKHQLTAEEAFYHPDSNIITQSLGDPDRVPEPGFIQTNLKQGDYLILCSDGLNSMIYDEDIELLLKQAGNLNANEMAGLLLESANQAGGNDNTTIAVFQLTEGLLAESKTPRQTSLPAWTGTAVLPDEHNPERLTVNDPLRARFKKNRKILLAILMFVAAVFSIFVFIRRQKNQDAAVEEARLKEQQAVILADSLRRDSLKRALEILQADSLNNIQTDTFPAGTDTINFNQNTQGTSDPTTEKKK